MGKKKKMHSFRICFFLGWTNKKELFRAQCGKVPGCLARPPRAQWEATIQNVSKSEKREGAKGRNGSDIIDRWTDLARSSNGNRLNGLVTSRGLDIFHGVDNVHTLKNMSKDDLSGNQKSEQNSIFRQKKGLGLNGKTNVSVIEPRSLDSANEELASVGVTASVSHGLI